MTKGNDNNPKVLKPYASPGLKEYGDIRTITGAVGVMGSPDGGSGVMVKTQ
jgi:hypothetical protein